MKNVKPLLITVSLLLATILVLPSCKKGDGDPFFSLLSRKARLAGEWQVTSLTQTYSYTNKEVSTTFDGSSKSVTYTVKDTTITIPLPSPHDSTYDYKTEQKYSGSIIYNFEKSGTYYYRETFKNDNTFQTENIECDGLWYFTGGNKATGYKDKELLGLQVTKFVFDPDYCAPYTTTCQGQNTLDIYEIYSLKSKEIVLKVTKEETIHFVKYTTVMEMKLIPR